MADFTKESRLVLAIEVIQKDENLSIRSAARIYNVPATTIRDRRAGRLVRRDALVYSKKLTDLEERTIV